MNEIRPAKASDAAKMRDIAQAAYHIYVAEMGKEPAPMGADYEAHIRDDRCFVAISGTKITGFVVILVKEGVWWLDNIAVAPDHQGKGIGRDLLLFAEAYVAGFANSLSLYTNIVMKDNAAWYRRMGYKDSHHAVCDGYHRFYFTKRLGVSSERD